MHTLIADSFNHLETRLVPPLFSPSSVPRLRKSAALLAGVLRLGFECRLSAGSPVVDLQQGFLGSEGEFVPLAARIRDSASDSHNLPDPGWRRLSKFCAGLRDLSFEPANTIHEVWLEHDSEGPQGAHHLPSVFVGLNPAITEAGSVYNATIEFIQSLRGGVLDDKVARNIRICAENAEDLEARISHIGIMLSRAVEAVRLNFRGISPGIFNELLGRIGWPGQSAAWDPILSRLATCCDEIRLCVDVGRDINPSLGFECFLYDSPETDPRWEMLLADLAELGLCSEEKAAAILDWPGYINPPDASAPWPPSLIFAAITQPDNRFGVLARTLNHIKVSFPSRMQPEAKAYLGFGHDWIVPSQRQYGLTASTE